MDPEVRVFSLVSVGWADCQISPKRLEKLHTLLGSYRSTCPRMGGMELPGQHLLLRNVFTQGTKSYQVHSNFNSLMLHFVCHVIAVESECLHNLHFARQLRCLAQQF